MSQKSYKNEPITAKMIENGVRQARVERSLAFFAWFDGLTKPQSHKSTLSIG